MGSSWISDDGAFDRQQIRFARATPTLVLTVLLLAVFGARTIAEPAPTHSLRHATDEHWIPRDRIPTTYERMDLDPDGTIRFQGGTPDLLEMQSAAELMAVDSPRRGIDLHVHGEAPYADFLLVIATLKRADVYGIRFSGHEGFEAEWRAQR